MDWFGLDIVTLLPVRPKPDASRFVIDILANPYYIVEEVF
jgi:hypothetical protein